MGVESDEKQGPHWHLSNIKSPRPNFSWTRFV